VARAARTGLATREANDAGLARRGPASLDARAEPDQQTQRYPREMSDASAEVSEHEDRIVRVARAFGEALDLDWALLSMAERADLVLLARAALKKLDAPPAG
jgi:hypothetical protein